MEDCLVDIGPELFQHKVGAVDQVAGEPLLADLGPRAVLRRVVERRNACRSARSDHLGEVEGPTSIVLPRNQHAGDGIQASPAEAAVAQRVEAVVLMKQDRPQAADHEVFVDRIGQRVPVVAAIAFDPLMKLRIRVAIHGEARLNARDEEGRVVEGVVPRGDELLLRGLRRQFDVCGDRAKVRHDPENALGLLGAVGADGVGICRLDGLGRGWPSGRLADRARSWGRRVARPRRSEEWRMRAAGRRGGVMSERREADVAATHIRRRFNLVSVELQRA